MYSIRIAESDGTGLPRLELFCNRCGVIYKFIEGSVKYEDISHIVSGHAHFHWPTFIEDVPPPFGHYW